VNDVSARPSGAGELQKRVISAIIMCLIAIVATIWGGWPFTIIWAIAALCVAYEWQNIVHGSAGIGPKALALLAVLSAVAAIATGLAGLLVLPLLLTAAAAAISPGDRRLVTAVGVVYAAGLAASVLLCRSSGYDGAVVIFWLFAVVWGTDTCAYFTGRSLGGPKLWPRISPKKTWSGSLGGLIGGVLLGCILLTALGVRVGGMHVLLSIAFSVLTQIGDLFESSLKRRFDVKDAGHLIPGHGGFMDRLDGFIFAVIFAALVGVSRAGLADVPRGLLTVN
jgi:phosphatidate cytidylyltransferase